MRQRQYYAGGQTGPLMKERFEGSQVIKRKRKLKEELTEEHSTYHNTSFG